MSKERAVIIACDFNSKEKLIEFLDKMEGADPDFYCKVGMELFYAGALQGFNPVKIIKDRGHKVFLDLKLKDIPNTVAKTAKVLVEAGADMINLHADGGSKMIKGVVDAINEIYSRYEKELKELENGVHTSYSPSIRTELEQKINSKPIILGVTVLTSMSEEELNNEIGVNRTVMEQVVALSELSKEAGAGGVVCSPQEVMVVQDSCGQDFSTVSPGIRFLDSKKDDQTRVATPTAARMMGAQYIVVGRPITEAEDPVAAYNRCKKEFVEGISTENEIESAKIYISGIKEKMLEPDDAVAKALIEAGAFKVNTEDPYLLKSGIASPLYCNCRALYTNPKQQKLVMDYLAELVRKYYPYCEAIYGTPMSAIAFGALIAERLGIDHGFVRNDKKDHGLETKIEGPVRDGLKAVAIEDLITSGTSSLQPVSALKESKVDVLGVAGIVDNDFIPSVKLDENGIEYHTITTMSKVAHFAGEQGIITPEAYDQVKAYMENPKDESWMSKDAALKMALKRKNANQNKG